VLDFLLRLAVGGTFLFASLDKIAHPDAFAQATYYYRMVPGSLLHPFALFLPWLEAVVGLALIVGLQRRGAAWLAGAMTLMFIVGIASALIRDLNISCGCFHTDGGHAVGLDLLWRDILLLAACALIYVQRPRP
jgi:uncharacterized membrane protein YphA (DoxX/SURF4 family)